MIKKLFIILLSLVVLSGCGSSSSMYSEIEAAANRAIRVDLSKIGDNNCVKKYYSYYLNLNVGRIESDDLSNIFSIDGNRPRLNGLRLHCSAHLTDTMCRIGSDRNCIDAIWLADNITMLIVKHDRLPQRVDVFKSLA